MKLTHYYKYALIIKNKKGIIMKKDVIFNKKVGRLAVYWSLFIGGAIIGSYTAQKKVEVKEPHLKQIIAAWNLTQHEYIVPVNEAMKDKMMNAAISGMLTSLDPHSEWYSREDAKKLNDLLKGQYGGIGIRFQLTEKGAVIKEVKEGSPADKKNIKAGDIILEVNNVKIDQKALSLDIWAGQIGSEMKIKIKRQAELEPEVLILKRENISGFEVLSEIKKLSDNKNWLRIQIKDFQETTLEEVAFHVRNLWALSKNEHIQLEGIVLDLRGSPGGLVPASAGLASLFLTENKNIVNVNMHGKQVDTLKTINLVKEPWSEWLKTAPLIVWDNKATASAAEILLAALKENDRVSFILGDQTFGKGTVQTIYEMQNGGQLKLSSAWYTTPKGHYIQANGVLPDYQISYPKDIEKQLEMYSESKLKGYLISPKSYEQQQSKKEKILISKEDLKTEDSVLNWYWKQTDFILNKK